MSSRATRALAEITQRSHILLTPSCTDALELACRLMDLKPGDEVILPSFNFPSAATAVALTGATPVFVDVDPATKNMTTEAVKRAITPQTRATIVLHYAGVAAPAGPIRALMDEIDGHVIEDAAHGLGVNSESGPLGAIGTFATYSFHETKNVQCGEGGALQINDARFVERAEILREKGTNRKNFSRGRIDKYSWIDHGSSWLLADPLAAILLGQLEEFREIQDARRAIYDTYYRQLKEWALLHDFEVAEPPSDQENAAHMFYLVASSLERRQHFMSSLRSKGIASAFHYQPLDMSEAGVRLGRSMSCDVSAQLGDRLVRLPLFAQLTDSEVNQVIDAVWDS